MSQFTLRPGIDLSIADTRNNMPYNIFLVRNLYTFDFRQCLTVLFKFSSIFAVLFCSQFNGLFRFLVSIHFLFTVRISANHSNSILSHFDGSFFYALQTLVKQWIPSYHINMILLILSLGSFF